MDNNEELFRTLKRRASKLKSDKKNVETELRP